MSNENPKNVPAISPELRQKAQACQSLDEKLELVKEAGIELTPEQLDQVSGGAWGDVVAFFSICPNCEGWDVEYVGGENEGRTPYHCKSCGVYWSW